MCRTIVGVSANLCAVDPDGKNIHSSVSCKFAETIKQVGGLPMVIPVGRPIFCKRLYRNSGQAYPQWGQNVHPSFYGRGRDRYRE